MIVTISRTLIFMVIAISINVIADTKAAYDSTRLVQAMKIGESALLGMKLSIQKGIQEGKTSKQQLRCINSVDSTVFVKIYSKNLKSLMTPSEIKNAIIFYESTLGNKYTEHGISQIYMHAGITYNKKAPVFSDNELNKLNAFSETNAGKRLIINKITQAPAINRELGTKIKNVFHSCSQSSS